MKPPPAASVALAPTNINSPPTQAPDVGPQGGRQEVEEAEEQEEEEKKEGAEGKTSVQALLERHR